MATQRDVINDCLFALHPTPWRAVSNLNEAYVRLLDANGGTVRTYSMDDFTHAKKIARSANRMA